MHRGRYYPGIDVLRFVLLICIMLFHYGLPGPFDIVRYLLGFSMPAVFITSGYIVLRESENRHKRILRTIKRSAVCLVILFICYLGFSYVFEPQNTITAISKPQFWIDFLVFNEWRLPPAGLIWYVIAFLYSYLIILIFEKSKLLKYDLPIAVIILVISAVGGEFAGLFHFNFLGHTFLPSSFFTRALPYILIGKYLHRNINKIYKIRKNVFLTAGVFGIFMSYMELVVLDKIGLLVYSAHFIGNTITAVALCGYFFKYGDRMKVNQMIFFTRWDLNTIFYIFPFLYYYLDRIFDVPWLASIVTLPACFVVFPIKHEILNIKKKIAKKRARKHSAPSMSRLPESEANTDPSLKFVSSKSKAEKHSRKHSKANQDPTRFLSNEEASKDPNLKFVSDAKKDSKHHSHHSEKEHTSRFLSNEEANKDPNLKFVQYVPRHSHKKDSE